MKVAMKDGIAMVGEGVGFERIRRITGYLVRYERFNNAKKAEEQDRVKHSCEMNQPIACCK